MWMGVKSGADTGGRTWMTSDPPFRKIKSRLLSLFSVLFYFIKTNFTFPELLP